MDYPQNPWIQLFTSFARERDAPEPRDCVFTLCQEP